MLLQMLFTWRAKLQGCKLVTFLLKSANDLSHKTTLNTVWLDSYTVILALYRDIYTMFALVMTS